MSCFCAYCRRSQCFVVLHASVRQNCNKPEHAGGSLCTVPVIVTTVHVCAVSMWVVAGVPVLLSPASMGFSRCACRCHDIYAKFALREKLLLKHRDMRNICGVVVCCCRSARCSMFPVWTARNCNKPEHAGEKPCAVPVTVTTMLPSVV